MTHPVRSASGFASLFPFSLPKTGVLVTCLFATGLLGLPTHSALAQEAEVGASDAVPGLPFKEGDVIDLENAEKLRGFLPPEFWEHREFFFYEGMALEIGPTQRDYTPAAEYMAATKRYQKGSHLGRDGALIGHKGGRPFPTDSIDCTGDPEAGSQIIWNFNKAWNGSGWNTNFFYSYWDRGEQLPLFYKGRSEGVALAQRVEEKYLANEGDVFLKEKRLSAGGVTITEPFDARGIMTLSYRYKASDNPLDEARNDDLWVYIPDLRRVRRISQAQRTDSIQGTDFSMDDLRSFNGIPPQYKWSCLKEDRVLHPINTVGLGFPYSDDYNYGPYGFSYANDRWEIRDAFVIRFEPKNEDHPYSRKDIWIDKQTYMPLYSFAYDRKSELWKIIWHNFRWTEDWRGQTPEQTDPMAPKGLWNPPWDGVKETRALGLNSQIIVNTQTGTGNRIEVFNIKTAPPPTKGKIRRLIDIGRLNKGR